MYVVDDEWRRRYPRKMAGVIICVACSRKHEDICRTPDGDYVRGHILVTPALVTRGLPASRSDIDLCSHLLYPATQRAAVQAEPESGIAQGAKEYLAALSADPRCSAAARSRIDRAFADVARRR
ncbi:hypothetical protein [Cellulomonas xiejunii]|uniref:Uncharacterized protein n=1 Tax=Cellulomonas xiejunii TaxID=2968083 RepID=A0ABY5KS70_9CELL|nr:hypothetical protein [Cellulomonas xiejunii]MCC2321350.1 hypothetical protein [Cellulomonas xiejunii]UUI71935.1 hypothetical protein NP048_00200 [Cellulomonas xiejunii]